MKIEEFMENNNTNYSYYNDICTCKEISEDKIELLESLSKYIKLYQFNSEIDYILENSSTIIQSEYNNSRILIKFDINENTVDDYERVGDQNIRILYTDFGVLYYSRDNHIFASNDLIARITDMDIYVLGHRLSKTAKELKLYDSALKANHESSINKMLEIGYKKGIIPLKYKYKNYELIKKKNKVLRKKQL